MLSNKTVAGIPPAIIGKVMIDLLNDGTIKINSPNLDEYNAAKLCLEAGKAMIEQAEKKAKASQIEIATPERMQGIPMKEVH